MAFGICNLSIVPVRKSPDGKQEMVTQLLFGELFEVLNSKDGWLQIKAEFDGYEGWIDERQQLAIEEKYFKRLSTESQALALDPVQVAYNDKRKFLLVAGSTLPDLVETSFKIGEDSFQYDGMVGDTEAEYDKDSLEEFAKIFLDAPYLWGGRSVFGCDCSGFTQNVFKLLGVKLKRDTHQQAEQGETVSDLKSSHIGDLAFFKDDGGKIAHVGIILSDEQIIHASARVRIDHLDDKGIFNRDTKEHTHMLHSIRRVI